MDTGENGKNMVKKVLEIVRNYSEMIRNTSKMTRNDHFLTLFCIYNSRLNNSANRKVGHGEHGVHRGNFRIIMLFRVVFLYFRINTYYYRNIVAGHLAMGLVSAYFFRDVVRFSANLVKLETFKLQNS